MSVVSADLKWYYSGGNTNTNPDASLGGEISTHEITSNLVENLFDNVDAAEATSGMTDYRCAYIKNTNGTDAVDDFVIWIASQTPSASTRIDVGLDPAGIGNGVSPGMATTISPDTDAPSGVAFGGSPDPVSKATGLMIGQLDAGESQAVWFRRVINAAAPAVSNDPCTISVAGTPL